MRVYEKWLVVFDVWTVAAEPKQEATKYIVGEPEYICITPWTFKYGYPTLAVEYFISRNGVNTTVADDCEIAKINCRDAVLSFGESATIAENEYVP